MIAQSDLEQEGLRYRAPMLGLDFNTSSVSNNGGFLGGLSTTIATIGTTFSNVWNSTHNTVPAPTAGTTTLTLPTGSDSFQLMTLLLAGGALLGALFLLFKGK